MSADVWDDIGDAAGERLRSELIDMVKNAASNSGRSKQTEPGPSQIGDPCTYCLASRILGVYDRGPFDDPWLMVIGTAVHKWLETAAKKDNKNGGAWCTETKVWPDDELLPKGGSCDLYQDNTGTVIDHKISSQEMIRKYKVSGPGLTYRRQAHLYGLGFANANLPVNRVAIAFWQRGGRTTDLYVWSEPYDENIARETLERYKTLRDLCAAGGEAILASLPSDPDCFNCSRNPRAESQPIPA